MPVAHAASEPEGGGVSLPPASSGATARAQRAGKEKRRNENEVRLFDVFELLEKLLRIR